MRRKHAWRNLGEFILAMPILAIHLSVWKLAWVLHVLLFFTCIRAISFIDRDHFISVSYFASRQSPPETPPPFLTNEERSLLNTMDTGV